MHNNKSDNYPCPDAVQLTIKASSGAIANGIDTNSAIATLTDKGRPLPGRPICFTLSGNARFSDGSQQMSVITNNCGEAMVCFTDTCNETITITGQFAHHRAFSQADFSALPSATDFQLQVRVVVDFSAADGKSANAAQFRLVSPSNISVYNKNVIFSVTKSAQLINTSGRTNYNGLVDVGLTNSEPEEVRLSAVLDGDPMVNQYVNLTFERAVESDYVITATPLTTDALNDPNRGNYVRFTLTQLGVGISGNLRISDINNNSITVTTAEDGTYTAYFTSTAPGNFMVRAALAEDNRVYAEQSIYFAEVVYPLELGTFNIVLPSSGVLSISDILGRFYITQNHIYSNGISSLYYPMECPVNSVWVPNQGCTSGFTESYEHISALYRVKALYSGLGENRYSRVYNIYPVLRQLEVTVTDLGPQP
ncbi:Ig-like domain-containing protein [Yersinia enterocolitica]|uniref:Ig-like domain-containing protein n=1 Tax=Yersinia enterocolitica TaxID=630 RepID=UPI003CFBE380